MNSDELAAVTEVARGRVLEIQAKLHRWARPPRLYVTGLVESPVPGRPVSLATVMGSGEDLVGLGPIELTR